MKNSDSNDEEGIDEDENKERSRNTDNNANDDQEGNDANRPSFFNSGTLPSQFMECKGSVDCIRGKVTEIVDGDTIDVNNVRVRYEFQTDRLLVQDYP